MVRMNAFSGRSLTIGYMLALSLIGLLAVASHMTLDRVLTEHEGSAAVVNVSGRQRMLSQRIASLAAQYSLGSVKAHDDLLETIDQFEAAHHKLLADSTSASLPAARADAFRAIYFGGTAPLDGEVAAFVDLARRVASRPPGAPDAAQALAKLFDEARRPLLARLDQVVQQHQTNSEEQLSWLEWLQRLTLTVVLATLTFEALVIFRPMVRRVVRYARELTQLATTDSLTGMLNRHSFLEHGQAEIQRARRAGKPVAVLMLDADHFKQINDTYGHDGGDTALRAVGQALQSSLRPRDLLGRMGGEEFAVLLTDTTQLVAQAVAERVRADVEKLSIAHQERRIALTLSIGLAASAGSTDDLSVLLRKADQALYAAKGGGRNRVAPSEAPAGL